MIATEAKSGYKAANNRRKLCCDIDGQTYTPNANHTLRTILEKALLILLKITGESHEQRFTGRTT